MGIVVNLDVVMAQRKISSRDLARAIGILDSTLLLSVSGKAETRRP